MSSIRDAIIYLRRVDRSFLTALRVNASIHSERATVNNNKNGHDRTITKRLRFAQTFLFGRKTLKRSRFRIPPPEGGGESIVPDRRDTRLFAFILFTYIRVSVRTTMKFAPSFKFSPLTIIAPVYYACKLFGILPISYAVCDKITFKNSIRFIGCRHENGENFVVFARTSFDVILIRIEIENCRERRLIRFSYSRGIVQMGNKLRMRIYSLRSERYFSKRVVTFDGFLPC